MFKARKSKNKKLAKSKNPLQSGNSSKFYPKKVGSSFFIPNTRTAFNHLQLAFLKAPIL